MAGTDIDDNAAPPIPTMAQHGDATLQGGGGVINEHDREQFFSYILEGDLEKIESILNESTPKDIANAYVTATDPSKRTALHHATMWIQGDGYPLIVAKLIEYAKKKQEYVARADSDEQTALHYAAYTGNIEVVKELINTAGNSDATYKYITEQDNQKRTALHYAAYGGNIEVVKELINTAGNSDATDKYITAQNSKGQTALHCAAYNGNTEVVKQLINTAGNNDATDKYITARDNEGQTALHCAAYNGNTEVVKQLINTAGNNDATYKYITARDNEGRTALHYAAQKGCLEVVETLISISPNTCLEMQCNRSWTPLHYACHYGSGNIAYFLLLKGTNPKIEDRNKETAWDKAVIAETLEAISALILHESSFSCPSEEILDRKNQMIGVYIQLCFNVQRLQGKLVPHNQIETSETIGIMTELISRIKHDFHYNQEAYPRLRSREPSCIFQQLEYSCHEGHQSFDFVSLVVPFIQVYNWAVIEARMEDPTNEYLHACVGKSHDFIKGSMPLTLDEYCSPALSHNVLKDRNWDQVLGRYESSKKERNNLTQTPTRPKRDASALLSDLWRLMGTCLRKLSGQQPTKVAAKRTPPDHAVFVRQAWIWKVGDEIIINPPELPLELIENGLLASQFPPWPDDPFGSLTNILHIIVKSLGDPIYTIDNPLLPTTNEPLLKTYENALSLISENVNQYVKKARIEDIDLEKEKQLFHEISDLQSELSMIKSVLAEQEEVWNEYLGLVLPKAASADDQPCTRSKETAIAEHSRWPQQHTRLGKIEKSRLQPSKTQESKTKDTVSLKATFDKYRRRITKLEQDAERVEQDIQIQLDLKQKHATMKEAHSLAVLSATIFGFTIITVIFAPLSFIVALFALPIDKFNEGKVGNDKDGVYSSIYVGKWSVATEFVSISVTLIAMWAALRFTGLHVWGKKGLREYIRQKADEARMTESTDGEPRKPDTEMGMSTTT